MACSRVAGGLSHSSLSSGIFFQGDKQSQAVVNSHLSSSFGNPTVLIPGTGHLYVSLVYGEINNSLLNSVVDSGPSVGESSLVKDANSALSGGNCLQRSTSINTESYLHLPASPLFFSSDNISISGSPVMDGSSVMRQSSQQDQNGPSVQQRQQQVLQVLPRYKRHGVLKFHLA